MARTQKNFSVLGDSISTFQGYSPWGAAHYSPDLGGEKLRQEIVQWGHYVSQREWNRGQFGGVSDVSNYLCANGSHFIPAWTDVIQHGFIKYYEKAQRLLEALDPNDPESIDKRIFYTGILEVLEAIRDWGERLSAACARRAREEKDPVRKQELENMAAMMKRVPWGPATSFHDACETAWAVCFFLFVEGAGPSITWGRFDQYMYPYYKEDIEKGILTPEKAMELIMDAIRAVRTRRSEMNVPPSKKATLYIETASQAIFEQSTAFLTRLAWADQIVMGSPEDLKGCVQVITDSAKVYMPLSQLVDRDKEIARLTKEKQACEKDISFLEGKLNNPGFVSKAPEKVVNDQKAKLEKAKELLSKIESSLAAFNN